MAVTENATLSIVSGDNLAGDVNLTKAVSLSFTGVAETLAQNQQIGVSAPSAPAVTATTGVGSLASGNYFTKITYVNGPQGESLPSAETGPTNLSATGELTVTSPAASGPATAYNVYMSSTSDTEKLQNASPIPIGQNYVQSTSPLSVTSPPGSNTTLTYTLNLPAATTQVAYVRNTSTSAQVVTVTWTPQGGSSNKVIDLIPHGHRHWRRHAGVRGCGRYRAGRHQRALARGERCRRFRGDVPGRLRAERRNAER